MKKKTVVFAAALFAMSFAFQAFASDAVTVRVGAMSGPTAMGMVGLMDQAQKGETKNSYEFADLMTDASAFVSPLTAGEIDIAAVPSNLAGVLYNKTEGGIKVLAVNVLSVLNIVERGESITQLSDLAGKTLYATGQGATPEAVLRHLLTRSGIDADQDLEIKWCADTTEALSYVTQDENAIAMLPQPFVTAAQAQVEDLRIALNLGEVWQEEDEGQIVTGVLAVRSAFLEEHPEEVGTFLDEYQASYDLTQDDPETAAALIAEFGIVPKAPLAQKALPNCGIAYLRGDEMKETLSAYLEVIAQTDASLVGGKLPEEDFYYLG